MVAGSSGSGREARSHAFLAGHSEMHAATRAQDRSKTAVGPIDDWPQGLRTAIGIHVGTLELQILLAEAASRSG